LLNHSFGKKLVGERKLGDPELFVWWKTECRKRKGKFGLFTARVMQRLGEKAASTWV